MSSVTRALLALLYSYPGSQSNLVTKDLVKKLGLSHKKVNIPVSEVCLTRSNVTETTSMHQIYIQQLQHNIRMLDTTCHHRKATTSEN